MVEVTKAIINKGNKYLFLLRTELSKHFPLMWDFPGGKLDPGETPEISCVRETKEETNYDIVLGKKLGVKIHEDKKYKDEKTVKINFFEIKSFSGELKLSNDHINYGWFTKEEIFKKKLHPSVKIFFHQLEQ